ASVVVLAVACPDAFSVPEPIWAAPSKNVTVPVGVPVPDVTVAVKVTDWPNVLGVGAPVTVVVVAAVPAVTVCVTGGEVLDANPAAPSYRAVIVCVPAVRADVLNVALPLASSVPVPRVATPSRNVTDPVGVPDPDVTVAVNVTDWPTELGFGVAARVVVVAAPGVDVFNSVETLFAALTTTRSGVLPESSLPTVRYCPSVDVVL